MCNGCFGGSCSGAMSFDTYDNANSVTTSYNNIWDFYAVVYDSTLGNNTTIVNIYKNGISLVTVCSSVNISTTNITSLIPITFGRYHATAQTFYNGELDDIGMWHRALTQIEITDLYNGCQLSVTTQPINQSVNISNNAQFTTAASDPLATYQWQTDLGVGYLNLNSVGQYSGTTNGTLSVANTTLSNNNQPFRCIVSSGACTDTSAVAVLTVVNNVGINEVSQSNLFTVYPNPTNSTLTINTKAIYSSIQIVNTLGQLVFTKEKSTLLNVSSLPSGIYFIQLVDNKGSVIVKEKFVKE
jgi:hypothetical protein